MDSWEAALDLDDSDLPSLLRPCKRHQSQLSQISSDSRSNPIFPSQHCSPTFSPPAQNQPPPPPPSRCLIPGPAGAMQAAMNRIGQRNEGSSGNRGATICTQDYIRRVEEDEAEEFTSDCWTSALDFLKRKGVRRTATLNDIKNCVNPEKIDMVVAMIKCCTPNGLGDMMVVLKDPTDTMHASIHRKVLIEGDYGRQIAIGSVLILQKVSVFSPLNKSVYLNISLGNVVKVFTKDIGKENYFVRTAKEAAPECHANLNIREQVSSGSGRTTKSVTDIDSNFKFNGKSSVQKHCLMKDHAGSVIAREPSVVNLVSFSQEAGTDKLASISSCIEPDIHLRDENIVQNLDDEHLSAANAFRKQTQIEEQSCTGKMLFDNVDGQSFGHENAVESQWKPNQNVPPPKDSFQEWTDEQLDILDMDY